MSWAASKAVDLWFQASRVARLNRYLELSTVAIRGLLLADVLADLLQLESDRGHRVAARPEVLSGKVPLLATQAGNSDGTLPLQKPNFLLGQRMENRPELLADWAENGLPPPLRDEHDVIFAVPFGMG